METLTELGNWYHYHMHHKADPRTKTWLLISEPWCFLIVLAYLIFVKVVPVWMKDREPYQFKKILVCYNFGLVLLSIWMFWEFFVSTYLNPNFNTKCQAMDYSERPETLRLARVVWWYYFSKIIELLDTVFFILKKKNSQVTFLHVYHHSTMVLLWWSGTKFVPGGEAWFPSMINCFIHVLMYTYYMMAAMGPHMQKYLWWKKYITKLQLSQFVIVVVHSCYAIYLDCGFPNVYLYMLIFYMASHIVLFSNFYHKSYVVKETRQVNGNHSNGGTHSNGISRDTNTNGTANGINGHYDKNGINGTQTHQKVQ